MSNLDSPLQRLYYTHDDLTLDTRVLACQPIEEGGYAVALAQTLFHPQGGGQPADTGCIGAARVMRVINQDGEVVHVTDRPVDLGDIHISIDPEPRHLHARLHSAGHLIGYCGEQLGMRPVKAHHWPGEARVVFEGEPGAGFEAESLQAQVQALVARDLPRSVSLDGARTVGFGELPAYGCGGTHVARLGEIGAVRIVKVKGKKGQWSVHYELD